MKRIAIFGLILKRFRIILKRKSAVIGQACPARFFRANSLRRKMEIKIQQVIAIIFICINITGFFMTGLDKRWAIRGQWRLAEKWFFRLTALGGGLGIFLGCLLFRHKIRNRAFMIGIPVVFLVEASLGVLLYSFLSGR